MYLLALVVGMCVAYVFLTYLFTAFFEGKLASVRTVSVTSLVFISVCIIAVYIGIVD